MLLLVIPFAILKIGFSICMFVQNRFMEEDSIPDKFRSSRSQIFLKIFKILQDILLKISQISQESNCVGVSF